MTGERPVVTGILTYLLVAVAPTLLFWVALRASPAVSAVVAQWRSDRRPRPAGPSLERAVADVRRLRAQLRGPGRSRVRRVATRLAYDDALVALCGILDVAVPDLDGPDRAFARLAAEAAVEAAGVAIDPPEGRGRTAA